MATGTRHAAGKSLVPDGWRMVRLGDISWSLINLVLGGTEPSPDDPGVRVLRATDLTRDGRVNPGSCCMATTFRS